MNGWSGCRLANPRIIPIPPIGDTHRFLAFFAALLLPQQLREWHKKWGREHERAGDVTAGERFREEEVARLAGLLGMEAAGLAAEPEEDH